MAFNGSGTYNLTNSPFVTGSVISSSVVNTSLNDIAANGLTNVICKDGQTTLTANIPMSNFKLTGLAAGSANGESLRYEQLAFGVYTQAGVYLLASGSVTAAGTLDLTANIDSTFDAYRLVLYNFYPVNNGDDLWLRVSEDGGSSFKAGTTAYTYAGGVTNSGGTSSNLSSGSGNSKIIIASSVSNGVTAGVSGEIEFFNPASAALLKQFNYVMGYTSTTPQFINLNASGSYTADTNAINALRLLFSTGNIATGKYILQGIRK